MSFTSELWQDITGIYEAILAHPFLTGLTDGSLPPGAFAFYVQQDALYLNQYARALSLVSGQAPDQAAGDMFARHAAGAIAVEQELHGSRCPEGSMGKVAMVADTDAEKSHRIGHRENT